VKLAKAAAEGKDQEFRESVKPCFENIITPTINDIIKTFTDNGHKAQWGQGVERISFDQTLSTLSFTVHFKKCVMQVDITASKLQKKINFDTRFTSSFNLQNSMNLTISETTEEKIQKFITQNVEVMQKHCS
jgi:hypothetical protein